MNNLGRPYEPISDTPASPEQALTVAHLVESFDWAEPRYLASGYAEVAVLDMRGIIERIITVFPDGSHNG